MRFFGAVLAFGLAALAVAGVALAVLIHRFEQPGPLQQDKTVTIARGSSVKKIARELTDAGVLTDPFVFRLGIRLNEAGGQLKAGEFSFPAHASAKDIMNLLRDGKTIQHQITFAEGLYTSEIVALINQDSRLTGEIGEIPGEGTLLPDTYNFTRNDTRQDIVNRMRNAQEKLLEDIWPQRQADLPVKTKAEAVILASIVEKETGIAAERPRVAGVFVNRLRKNMLLQTDPTVIYAVTQGTAPLGRSLTYKDLKNPDPYNTYVHAGLPPGPIANPGRESIRAALQPESHDYLYFVADGTGGHSFAKTLKEHNRNVAHWRRIRNKK